MEDLEGQEAAPTTENKIPPAQLIVNIVSLVDEKLDIARANRGLDVNGYAAGFYHGTKDVAEWVLGAIVEHRQSSSNETTEPPAKEKYSAFTPGPWHVDGHHGVYGPNEELIFAQEREYTEPDNDKHNWPLISAAPDLYDACEKALDWFDRYGKAPVIASQLEAALTKAGKK